MTVMAPTHYEVLGVDPASTLDELRRAYRIRVRSLHPDATGAPASNGQQLAAITRAWRILSDDARRRDYDDTLTMAAVAGSRPIVPPPPAPQSTRSRREAWVLGVRAQIVRLASQAGRSATQTLLLRHPRGTRAAYGAVVERLVYDIAVDTEARVRAARAAGAAPLDLGVGATLIGIRAVADSLRRRAGDRLDNDQLMAAELLDRMWDVLAHELPVSLAGALGGNPDIARKLSRHAH